MKPFLLSALLLAGHSLASASPGWLERALEKFPERLPPGVACTVEIHRDGRVAVERHNPSRASGQRWALLSREGRPPTSEERIDYLRTRAAADEPAYLAAFRVSQLDLSRATIVHESDSHATVRMPFREEAIESDRLLGRVDLTLLIAKVPARVVRYRLQLPAPFSPVLGVRMHDIDSGAEFGADGLPRRSYSRFRGRIFFRTVSEDIEVRYSAYSPGALTPSKNQADSPTGK